MKTIQLTKEQFEKIDGMVKQKQAYHDAIRKHGPSSEEARRLRDLINKK